MFAFNWLFSNRNIIYAALPDSIAAMVLLPDSIIDEDRENIVNLNHASFSGL